MVDDKLMLGALKKTTQKDGDIKELKKMVEGDQNLKKKLRVILKRDKAKAKKRLAVKETKRGTNTKGIKGDSNRVWKNSQFEVGEYEIFDPKTRGVAPKRGRPPNIFHARGLNPRGGGPRGSYKGRGGKDSGNNRG